MAIRTKFNPLGVGNKYNMNEVVISGITSGSGSITLPAGVYKLELIGGGGAGYFTSTTQSDWYNAAGGGSGGGFVGEIYLPAGIYTYAVGEGRVKNSSLAGGNSTFIHNTNSNAGITANGGGTGTGSIIIYNRSGGYGGTCTIGSAITHYTNTVGSNTDQNNGTGYQGGAVTTSIYGSTGGGSSIYNGYGKGGDGAWATTYGASGYLKLTYLRKYW